MRILMLTDMYAPVIGGMEQYVQRLSRELSRRGHTVSVATLAPPGTAAFEVDGGVEVHRLRGLVQSLTALHSDPGRPFAPPFPDPRAAWGLNRLLQRNRWDIVHGHNWLVHSFLPLQSRNRIPLVMTLHDYSLACAKKTLLFEGAPCSGPSVTKCLSCAVGFFGPARGLPTALGNWGMQLPLRHGVDLFLPVSDAVAKGNRLAMKRMPFHVVPNFVADELLTGRDDADADPRLAQLPKDDFLLYVGGLDRAKGVDVLLRAYAGLENAPPLVLIGATRPNAVTELPPNVVLLKDWPQASVQRAWRRSLMGLVPSVWPEPCPTVALEAMAAGKPVIASCIGGLPELVVDGETGLLVPAGNPQALRRAIGQLLAQPATRERMGAAAQRRVESSFTASRVVPEIERTYARLVGGSACQAA